MLTVIILSIATFISTLLGGLFAIRFKDKLHYIMAFAAGVLLGVVAFDIFPEIIEQVKIYNFGSVGIIIPFKDNEGNSSINIELFRAFTRYSASAFDSKDFWGIKFSVPIL